MKRINFKEWAYHCRWRLGVPDLTERGSTGVFRKARFAPLRGGLRPGLTENAGAAFEIAGRDEETARNRTKKQV